MDPREAGHQARSRTGPAADPAWPRRAAVGVSQEAAAGGAAALATSSEDSAEKQSGVRGSRALADPSSLSRMPQAAFLLSRSARGGSRLHDHDHRAEVVAGIQLELCLAFAAVE